MHEVYFDVIEYADRVEAVFGVGPSPALVTRFRDESKWLCQIVIEMSRKLQVARRMKKQIDRWCQILHIAETIGQSASAVARDNGEIATLDSSQMPLHQGFSAILDQRSYLNHGCAICVGKLSDSLPDAV